MIDLPTSGSLSKLSELVDWAELCAIASPVGEVSAEDIADVMRDSGRFAVTKRDVFAADEDDEDLAEDEGEVDDVVRDRAIEVVVAVNERQKRLGDAYHLKVSRDVIVRDEECGPAFSALCVFANLVRYPVDVEISRVDGISFRQLFESIVEASSLGLFGGSAARFGWPIQDGWPTTIEARIAHMGDILDLDIESLTDKLEPLDKDNTLDVLTRFGLGDDGPGTLMVLTQCAVGRNWRDKSGEPNLTNWNDIYKWQATLVRAVAFPWWLGGPRDYARQNRHFAGAMILDRPRILGGRPDSALPADTRATLSKWVEAQLTALPQVN